jgi:TolA-binding protein
MTRIAQAGLAAWALAAAVWAAPGAARAQSPALPPEEVLASAMRLEKEGAFGRAAAAYEGFLRDYPDHVQSANMTYRLAMCYDSVGQPEKAIATYEKLVAAGPGNRNFKHRSDTIMALAKLYGEAKKYGEGVKVLQVLLKEGASLYEDEAQNTCAGYLALLERYEEAAVLFSALKGKEESSLAKEAAYKLAIVWMKANKTDLAKAAVEEFVQRFPGHPRVLELMIRVARHLFDEKQYKSAASVCSQVLRQYKTQPEALEAAFIVALCHRDTGAMDRSVEAFDAAARMPQGDQNLVLASECLFEAAQLCRTKLNREDDAMEFYRRAAHKARDPATDRQKLILEHSLFHLAEYHFKKEEWSAALDLYLQMRKLETNINVLSRILHCQSKLDKYGGASISAESEEERKFIEARIAANPGSLVALQGEVFLLDKKLETALMSSRAPWAAVEEIVAAYGKLLAKYPADVLAQQSLKAYIKMRMGSAYGSPTEDSTVAELKPKWQAGLKLYEEALAEAPDSLFRVEMLEGIAALAERLGESRKAFDAYAKLYDITGKEPPKTAEGEGATPGKPKREAFEYLRGLAAIANTPDLVDEAIAKVNEVINFKPEDSKEGREARFYLGELYFMKQRYSDAALAYLTFVRKYGPPMDLADNVLEGWVKPPRVEEVLDQVYESGIRIAQCWYAQGHRQKMLQAFEWVIRNQNHQNPRVAEALYSVLTNKRKGAAEKAPEGREELAEALWRQVVNPSMDFGSKQFLLGYHFWVRSPVALPFVKNAILLAGDLYGKSAKHSLAAQMFQQYLELFAPEEKRGRGKTGNPMFVRDEQYEIASYAVGREFIQAGDFENMARYYRPYIDGFRDAKFRVSILTLLGHYGTQAELFEDAREAYAALLDEYGEPNPPDKNGNPIPVPKEKRLRSASSWNGVRAKPPDDWNPGKIRYSLGFLYWKKEDWRGVKMTLAPFVDDAALARNESRDEALFMLGRGLARLKEYGESVKVLDRLVKEYPKFKGREEAIVDLAKACVPAQNWPVLDENYATFVKEQPDAARRPYMDLYRAISQLARGQSAEAVNRLRDLSRADTYSDLKAESFYHLGLVAQKGEKPDMGKAFDLLERSVELYPRAESLLELGRCAVTLRKWAEARKYLDRCRLEFPKSDPAVLDDAKKLLEKVAVAEAKR